jgi:transcriptional regulator with XRE-family HTH domain
VAKPIGADKKRQTATLPEALGAELTRQRANRRWSQQQLAEKLGYDVSYIGQIERGEKSPTLRTLMNLSEVFDLRLSALIRAAESRIRRLDKSTGE